MTRPSKIDKKYNPTAEYRFFYYDGEGDGFVYFKCAKLRDACANEAIIDHLWDTWDESVENIIVGEATGQATKVNVELRPDELDEDGCDEEGNYWDPDWGYTCNYKALSFDEVEAK